MQHAMKCEIQANKETNDCLKIILENINRIKQLYQLLECGPVPNVMAALPLLECRAVTLPRTTQHFDAK